MPVVSYKEFYWWISIDEFLPQKWGCYDCAWLEIRKKSKKMYLSNDTWTEVTVSWNPTVIDAVRNVVYSYASPDTSYIYNLSGTLLATNPWVNGHDIRNYIVFRHFESWSATYKDKLLFARSYIGRWDTTNPTDVVYWTWALSDITDYRPALVYGDKAYFWNGYKLGSIDSLWDLTVAELTFDQSETVIWLTNIWNQMYIYTRDSQNTYIYEWDFLSTTYTWRHTHRNLLVRWVINSWNYDYMRCSTSISPSWAWWETQLYKVIGYNKQIISYASFTNENADKLIYNSSFLNSIHVKWDILYLPARGNIYTYWTKAPWLPASIVREFSYWGYVPWDASSYEILALSSDLDKLYYSFIKAWTSKIGSKSLKEFELWSSSNKYWSYWYWISNPYIVENTANLQAIRLKYKLPHSSCSIKVYYKLDDWDFTLIDNTFTYESSWIKVDFRTQNGEFSKIQFKIELLSSNSTYTPEVYKFDFKYEDIKNDF